MHPNHLNEKIIKRGNEIFAAIADEKPSLFNKNAWMGKVMNRVMEDPQFKEALFRFVDVYPSLQSRKALSEHVKEYFGADSHVPDYITAGAKIAGSLGSLGGLILVKTLSANIRQMGRQFIIGENVTEALHGVRKLHQEGYGTVIDVLGEATLSYEEAEEYIQSYIDLLDTFRDNIGTDRKVDKEAAPEIQVAVKTTALYCLTSPQDFEGSVAAIVEQLRRLLEKAIKIGAFLCIDMESYRFKDITLEVYRRLRLEYSGYPYFGVVLQSYLRDTERDLDELLEWAESQNVPISIRLVKGAYWDYETIIAEQAGHAAPVWLEKAKTDAAYERQAFKILKHNRRCHFACASHNVRTIAAVLEMASELQVPPDRYEFQLLYGMAEPVRRVILRFAGRVRLYCPYGKLIPGMGYLVRRLIENTSNESFLRRSFAEKLDLDQLLEDPVETLARTRSVSNTNDSNAMVTCSPDGDSDTSSPGDFRNFRESEIAAAKFRNEPEVDFTRIDHRESFRPAIDAVRRAAGKTLPLIINGKEHFSEKINKSVNPANPEEYLGYVSLAGTGDLESTIVAAKRAFPEWRDTPGDVRAGYLTRAAQIARSKIFELAAWQILEIGKQWDQAYGDITEAIDFMEYYAGEMIRLGDPVRTGNLPGEVNRILYEGRGIAAVIAPWNFPLAISAGMTAAAMVSGNCVIYKPSSLTPFTGYQLAKIYEQAGVPPGVFQFLPGRGSTLGDDLVDHPDVSLIAFTGSVDVGLRIIERAAKVHPGQEYVKRVVCEMGGKNAIIIDDDADLDEAVPQVLRSAFAFQGQKCSACSRVIVLNEVYERFVERLVALARAIRIGPSEDPQNFMGPVADEEARTKIMDYVRLGIEEGTLLYKSEIPESNGYYVPLTIVGDIRPEHRLAQEEIFGPVLSIMRAADFDEALRWANGTKYALTGGVFSRSPEHIHRAAREFRVGNLYLNRGVTGSMINRQPFGGARMSGGGTKAGGPDYLKNFMDARVVTENTMRRGFVSPDTDNRLK